MKIIKLCDACPNIDIEKLENLFSVPNEIEFEVGCISMCAVCQTKAFAVFNGVPIICNTEDELIEKLKNML